MSKGELVPLASHGVYLKLIQTEDEAIAALRMYAEIAVVHNDMVRQMKISAEQFYEEALKPNIGIIIKDAQSIMAIDMKDGYMKAHISSADLTSKPAPSNFTHPKLIARGHMFAKIKKTLCPEIETLKPGKVILTLYGGTVPSL